VVGLRWRVDGHESCVEVRDRRHAADRFVVVCEVVDDHAILPELDVERRAEERFRPRAFADGDVVVDLVVAAEPTQEVRAEARAGARTAAASIAGEYRRSM
jgi:hypothetical protein